MILLTLTEITDIIINRNWLWDWVITRMLVFLITASDTRISLIESISVSDIHVIFFVFLPDTSTVKFLQLNICLNIQKMSKYLQKFKIIISIEVFFLLKIVLFISIKSWSQNKYSFSCFRFSSYIFKNP